MGGSHDDSDIELDISPRNHHPSGQSQSTISWHENDNEHLNDDLELDNEIAEHDKDIQIEGEGIAHRLRHRTVHR